MRPVAVFKNQLKEDHLIPLPGSKSESNRALIINALCENSGQITNLAIARDTDIMSSLLAGDTNEYNAQDAGTVMRFMTAYLAITQKNVSITGTDRMKLRPIGVLVDALQRLGADISYLEKVGYPPVSFGQFTTQITSALEIDGDVSSQYISALLMVAPRLPEGLKLSIKGDMVSKPYIDMTMSIMHHFGVNVDVSGQDYLIEPQAYHFSPFSVEADWSGASYWYSIFVLSDLETLSIAGLKNDSTQGDSVLKDLMQGFGVFTRFEGSMAILTKRSLSLPKEIDFIDCPDLAQTFAVLCAAMNHECRFYGLQTLKIKETDRVLAIKSELNKLGGDFIEEGESWRVTPIPYSNLEDGKHYDISTYEDHRMAMAFAPLAVKVSIRFDDADVVNKSYPTFWQDLEKIGFNIE